MFDYVQNKFNLYPEYTTNESFCKKNLCVKFAIARYLSLPENIEEFRKSHSRKFWYTIKRSEKKYIENFGKLNFGIITDPDELDFFLDGVQKLFYARWKDTYTSCQWKTTQGFYPYKLAMIDMAKNNLGFLAVLCDENSKVLSFAYCIRKSSTIYLYQHATLRDKDILKYSLGKVLFKYLLEFSIKEGVKIFDFMTGDSKYKKEWAKSSKNVYKIIGRKSIKNFFISILIRIKYFFQFNRISRRILKKLMHLIN